MSSEVATKLPIIDFKIAELKPGTDEWISVRENVYTALEEYGCFEALLDGTPKERLFEKLKQVFDLSPEGNPKFTIQERLVIWHPLSNGVIDSFSKKLWLDGDQEFCDMVHSYVKRLTELDEMVRRMTFEKLGIEKYWEEHNESTSSLIAFFRYKVPEAGDQSNIGLAPHTDKHITTILCQHSQHVNGLQFMKKDGKWIDAEYSSPHSFIFLANDCFTALTNGRVHNPLHQVIMGKEERYSIGFNTIGKEGYIIKAPEELVDEEHPVLYKPFEAVKLFEVVIASKGATTLESYCGVST